MLDYDGMYLPFIGDGHSSKTVIVSEYRFGGWNNAEKWWSFSYGIKCLLSNPKKPFKQRIIDDILENKELKIIKLKNLNSFSYIVATKNNEFIGDIGFAHQFSDYSFFTSDAFSSLICTAWNEKEQKACAWINDVFCYFNIGDKIFDKDFGDETTLFNNHGTNEIKNKEDAIQCSLNFVKFIKNNF